MNFLLPYKCIIQHHMSHSQHTTEMAKQKQLPTWGHMAQMRATGLTSG